MIIKKEHKPVSKGERVGVFVPSSPINEGMRNNGRNRLEEMGLEVEDCAEVLSNKGYLSKNIKDNIRDIKKFLEDDEIRILWAGRGGYGSNYLIRNLRNTLKNINISGEKIIIGSSDVSYILWEFMKIPNIKVIYGPMSYASVAKDEFDENQLKELLFGMDDKIEIDGDILIEGEAEGILTGGCLSNFISLIGTPFLPDIKDKILLLEDLNERPYRLDRMFWQIENAGIFNAVNGVILGEFPGCFNDKYEQMAFNKFLRKIFQPYGFPVIMNVPVGHSKNAITVPLGTNIII